MSGSALGQAACPDHPPLQRLSKAAQEAQGKNQGRVPTAHSSWKIPPCAGAAENPDTPAMRDCRGSGFRVWGRLCRRGQFSRLPVPEVSPGAGLSLSLYPSR